MFRQQMADSLMQSSIFETKYIYKMKSITITLFFCLLIMHLTAKEFEYPSIKTSSNSIADFVPSKWKILQWSKGDLNSDKNVDIAFVLEYSDKVTFTKSRKDYDGNTYNDEMDCSPRILVIAIFNPRKKQYEKTAQNNTFIMCADGSGGLIQDPFEKITIRNQIVEIEFRSMSGIHFFQKYKFKLQNNEFTLIGIDKNTIHRVSGDYEDLSFNLITNKVESVTGNLSSKKEKTSWKLLNSSGKFTLATISDSYSIMHEEKDENWSIWIQ